jgi:hypothetical protein
MEERIVAQSAFATARQDAVDGTSGRPVRLGGAIQLPTRTTTARAPSILARALPAGLVGMAGLVLVIEWLVAIGTAGAEPQSRVEHSWRFTAQHVPRRGERLDVVCFGDSLVKLGILPRVLQAHSGLSAANLAVLAGQAPTSYLLLRRVLETGHRPRAVIVDFSAPMLSQPPSMNSACWAAFADHRDFRDLISHTRDPFLILRIAVCWACPSWNGRDTIRVALLDGLHGGVAACSRAADCRVFERNWHFNRGAQVAPRDFVPVEKTLARAPEPAEWDWRPHPVNAAYVVRFLRMAESHGILVCWVLPPATPAWCERHRAAGVIQAHQNFVRSCVEQFPALVVLDAQCTAWDIRAFRDPIHLNRDGALALSLAVGDAITAALRGTLMQRRWLALDASARIAASPALEGELEDLDQSRLALSQNKPRPLVQSAEEQN